MYTQQTFHTYMPVNTTTPPGLISSFFTRINVPQHVGCCCWRQKNKKQGIWPRLNFLLEGGALSTNIIPVKILTNFLFFFLLEKGGGAIFQLNSSKRFPNFLFSCQSHSLLFLGFVSLLRTRYQVHTHIHGAEYFNQVV